MSRTPSGRGFEERLNLGHDHSASKLSVMENSLHSVPQETVDQALGQEEAASTAIVQATKTAIADSRHLLAEIATEMAPKS